MNELQPNAWMNSTTLNPLGLAILVVLGLAVLLLPRRYVPLPFMVMGCFVSQAQNIVVLGLAFYLLRTLALIALIRCLVRGELLQVKWNRIDSAVLASAVVSTLIYGVQVGAAGLVTKLGWLFDSALVYYVARSVLCTIDDVRLMTQATVVISIPVLVAFLIESATARNMFAVFGGVPAFTEMREGRLRCQGAFAHAILAGCFWASTLPMVATLWWHPRRQRGFVAVGLVCAIAIVILCASSTPVVGVLAGLIGGLCFFVRGHLRLIRWSAVGLLVLLHLVMKAPVWALVQRVDLIGGSTGNFRYRLIDGAIQNVGEWWLIGTRSTAHWGWGLQDVCNQYILEGVRGGLVSLLAFLIVYYFAFQRIGQLVRASTERDTTLLYWGIGVALFVHCVNFMGVSYFGQILMLLNFHLASVSCTGSVDRVSARRALRRDHFAVPLRHYGNGRLPVPAVCVHGHVGAATSPILR